MRVPRSLAVLLACAAAACPARADGPKVVGAVGAANAGPVGRAPGGAVRTLVPGGDIYFRDRITTKRGGSAQLAFLDRSTLSVGENSDLVIDEFVYKPGGAGTMSASLTKGVLRYVGGDISHGGGTTIRTPTVTIGIRGGIGMVGTVDDAEALRGLPGVPADFHGGTVVVNGYGTLTLRNAQSEVVLTKPGFAAFVGSAGAPIGAPVRVGATTAQAMMAKLTSRAGQRGGAPPAKAGAASAASATIAPRMAALVSAAPVAAPPPAPTVNALDFTSTFAAGSSLARNRSQARQAVQLAQVITAAKAASDASSSSSSNPTTVAISSPGAATSSSGSAPTGSLPSNLTGTTGYHDINATTVSAYVIYAHNIDAQYIYGTIHYVNGNGNGGGGVTSGVNIIAATINAHNIQAYAIFADDIYVDTINGH